MKKKTRKKIKSILKKIKNNIPNIIALIALFVSIKALRNANEQFELNSKNSDSLFNIQLQNERELNDSLLNQLNELQIITSKQLETTDRQLDILTETLNEKIYSARPKFQIGKTFIQDSIIKDGIFSPAIMTQYKNIGQRFAYKTRFKCFVVYPDFTNIRSSIGNKGTMTIEPKASFTNRFKPEIPLKYKNDFYFCFELEYYDNVLKKVFTQRDFYHYFKSRGRFEFSSCSDKEKLNIVKTVNRVLDKYNETPIGF